MRDGDGINLVTLSTPGVVPVRSRPIDETDRQMRPERPEKGLMSLKMTTIDHVVQRSSEFIRINVSSVEG